LRDLTHLEAGRFRHLGGDAHNGAFRLIAAPTGATLHVIASDGGDWDHVSVSVALESRSPSWEEMAWTKEQFFDAEEAVMQLHPPRSQYVNNHPYCLHMWRSHRESIPLPPVRMVGIPGLLPKDLARFARAVKGRRS